MMIFKVLYNVDYGPSFIIQKTDSNILIFR